MTHSLHITEHAHAGTIAALIVINDALVAEIESLDSRIHAIGFTPRQFRRERLMQFKLQREQKIERHKELVKKIKELSLSAKER